MLRGILSITGWMLVTYANAAIGVTALRTEYLVRPLNVEKEHPRLSWVITSDENDVRQTAYRIIAATSEEKLNVGKPDLWDSGTVTGNESIFVPYNGKELKTNQHCYWRVKVTTNRGESPWSETAEWAKGPSGESSWRGYWIGWDAPFEWDDESVHSRLSARYLRKTFEAKETAIARATLHISGLGMYELFINGDRVGSQVLSPAPADYRKKVIYNTFDVTEQLQQGTNAIGVILGNGRYYTMRQNYKPHKITNFGYPTLRLNLVIEYTDGTTQRINSDESWRLNADGPIRSNNEYDGEDYDARKDLGNWTTADYDDSAWLSAKRTAIPQGSLHGNTSENMEVMKSVAPTSITEYGNRTIIDFGQNMAGRVVIHPHGKNCGDSIVMRYAERLTAGGDSLYTENLRDAMSRDVYVCNGNEKGEPWAATFSYHGFRYVEVTGMTVSADDITAEMIYDKMDDAGTFECSNEVINSIVRNAWWGIASNYKGMPVDCPQRNERQPWLGDRTMGAWGESYLFDNHNLYAKWMEDICQAQREDGCIPDVAPAFWNYYTDNMTWPAALPFICDMIYRQYGDIEPMKKAQGTIRHWIEHMRKEYMDDGIMKRDKYGDWCMPPEEATLIHSNDPERKTDGSLIATAYFYKVCTLMADYSQQPDYYDSLASATKTAFNRTFLTVKHGTSQAKKPHILYPDSIFYGNNTATANILPLAFGMVPDEYVEDVRNNVIQNIITKNNGHVSCGVIGLQWLMRQLTAMGRGDVAFLLATNTTYPSYGYMIEHGATTIWELWNGDTASPKMNSGNHVMLLGDLLYWLYADIAGIAPASPGYKEISMHPDFSIQNLEHAHASYNTPYGTVESQWTKNLEHLSWDITVPCNTTAKAYLPGDSVILLTSGKHHIETDFITMSGPDEVNGNNTCNVKQTAFLYEQANFPECHASTIVETADGDLVAAFFGGTKERNPDCCIYVCRKEKDSDTWTAPELAADGVFRIEQSQHNGEDSIVHTACWNPVLFRIPGTDELLLFYKIGKSVAEWSGWLVRSNDGGRTWSKREPLPDGFLGPIKNKPVYVNGRIISPSSTEGKGGWKIHFELSDDGGKTWRKTAPEDVEQDWLTSDRCEPRDSSKRRNIYAIQPTIIVHDDGHLTAYARTRNAKLAVTHSYDNGETWSKLTLSDVENNNSGIDAVTLSGIPDAAGTTKYVLVYNDFETIDCTPKGARTPLSIATSTDGITWQHALTLEDSPVSQYSYPSMIQGSDGTLHIVYTWRRQRIKYVNVKL